MNSYNQSNHENVLDRLSDELALELIPAMMYVGILMILGLIGNVVVCYIFVFRIRITTQNVLIVALACFDLMSCSIAMPSEIVDMRYFYNFNNSMACRMMRVVNGMSSFGSIFTLIVIAIYRYKKIVLSVKWVVSIKKIIVVFVVIFTLTIIFTTPISIMSGIRTIETPLEGVLGHDCSTNEALRNTPFPLFFDCVLFVMFFMSLALLSVIYARIWHAMKTHDMRMCKISITLTTASGRSSPFATRSGREDVKPSQIEPVSTVANFPLLSSSTDDVTGDCVGARGDTPEGVDMKAQKIEPGEEGEIKDNEAVYQSRESAEQIQRGSEADFTEPGQIERPPHSVFTDSPQNSRTYVDPMVAVVKKSDCADTGVRSARNEEKDTDASLISTTQRDLHQPGYSTGGVAAKNGELQQNINAKVHKTATSTSFVKKLGVVRLSLQPVIMRSKRSVASDDQPDSMVTRTLDGSEYRLNQRLVSHKSSTRSLQGRPRRCTTTITAFSVTAIFFISFLPHISLHTSRLVLGDFDVGLRGVQLVLYNIFLRSYFINASFNPIIYGMQNVRFRAESYRLLRTALFLKREDVERDTTTQYNKSIK